MQKIPPCIAFVMDGNRRWAKERGLSVLSGYEEGYKRVKDLIGWSQKRNIGTIILFGFSSENWQRPPGQVSLLMNLLRRSIFEDFSHYVSRNIKLSVIGQREKLASDIIAGIEKIEEKTKDCDGLHFVLAISYGGRAEIVSAVNKLQKEKSHGSITEDDIAHVLWTGERNIPEPDMIIRTGGEKRMSNFLLWQSGYSELFFLDKHWPDFSLEDLDFVIKEFNVRKRNFGA